MHLSCISGVCSVESPCSIGHLTQQFTRSNYALFLGFLCPDAFSPHQPSCSMHFNLSRTFMCVFHMCVLVSTVLSNTASSGPLKKQQQQQQHLFVAEPREFVFMDYQVGASYMVRATTILWQSEYQLSCSPCDSTLTLFTNAV